MAPQYKLTYLTTRGIGEGIRFLLSYMGEDFEDVRVEKEKWPAMSAASPFGKLPLLEVGGKVLSQSIAIDRYLGRKAGLAGKDEWEDVQIDIIADTLTDARLPISAYWNEPNPEVKKAKKETYKKETAPFYLETLEAVVKENGGYLANKKLSWVDIIFVPLTDLISVGCEVPDVTVNHPNLHALRQKVTNIPQIKNWIAKRPETDY